MAQLVCKRYGAGPRCSDVRLETTDAEQEDCINNALRQCTIRAYDCITSKIRGTSFDSTTEFCVGCMGELECYNSQCKPMLEKCYCTSLSGLICTTCEDEPDEEEEEEPVEETEFESRNLGLRSLNLTVSSSDGPIPITFGTVVLGGNIIWIGNARKEVKTIRTVQGNVIETESTEHGFVDVAVAYAKGEIDAISRLWVGETLVINNSIATADADTPDMNPIYYDLGLNVDYFYGSEAQKVSASIADAEGFGRAPAHRDLVYILFRNFPVYVSSGALPLIQAELVSEVDTTAPQYEFNVDLTVDPGLLVIDGDGGRVYVGENDEIKVLDYRTLAEMGTITHDDGINTSFVSRTPDGSLVFVTNDDEMIYAAGYDNRDRVTLTTDGAMLVASAGVRVTQPGTDTEPPSVVTVVATGHASGHLRLDLVYPERQTAELLADYTLDFVPLHIFADKTLPVYEPALIRNMLYAVGIEDGILYVARKTLSFANNTFKLTDSVPNVFPYDVITFGFDTPVVTIVNVIPDFDSDRMIVVLKSAQQTIAVCLELGTILPSWIEEVPEPEENLAQDGLRRRQTREYRYVDVDQQIISLDLETGATFVTGDLNTIMPGFPVQDTQYFDGSRNSLTYNSDGDVVRLFLNRYVPLEADAARIIQRVATEMGISLEYVDVSDVEGLEVTGFVIADQASAAEVYQQLSDFFSISIVESSGKIIASRRSQLTGIEIDVGNILTPKETIGVTQADEVTAVRIKYYDTTRDGGAFTQTVTRDFLNFSDDFVSNTEEIDFIVPVFTDPTSARQAAEQYMTRLTTEASSLEFLIGPRDIKVTAGDIVKNDLFVREGYRVRNIDIDTNLQMKIMAAPDAADLYATASGLSGVSLPLDTRNDRAWDAPVRVYPILFSHPPTEDGGAYETVYVGLVNPDDGILNAGYDPTNMRLLVRSAAELPDPATTPTTELAIGRLQAPPTDIFNEFTTQWRQSITVVFNKTVDASYFSNLATAEPIYENYRTNLLFVGKELLQYLTYSIAIDNKTVTFTGLVRGRFGTDQYVNQHAANELVAVYTPTSMTIARVPTDAPDVGFVSAIIYDARNPRITKTDDREIVNHLDTQHGWRVGTPYLKKGVSVQLRAAPRHKFRNTFQDALQQTSMYGSGQLVAAYLDGPYNETNFQAEVDNNFADIPVDFAVSTGHTGHVRRLLAIPGVDTSFDVGISYSYVDALADGVQLLNDVFVVIYYGDVETLKPTSPLRAFSFGELRPDTLTSYAVFQRSGDST